MFIVIPNHFGKHVNRTFEIKIAIYKNKMLIEKDKLLSKQKDAASTFNKHFGSITHSSLNLFCCPEVTSMLSGNGTINSIIKKVALHPSIKAKKKKFKI